MMDTNKASEKDKCTALMLAAGVDLKVVSALLGHSSISTTANLYTEVLDSTKAEAAKKISMQLGQTEKIP